MFFERVCTPIFSPKSVLRFFSLLLELKGFGSRFFPTLGSDPSYYDPDLGMVYLMYNRSARMTRFGSVLYSRSSF